jgi:hypothetical protein
MSMPTRRRAAALSPDGKRLLTTSSGAARIDAVDLFDLAARQRTGYVPYDARKAPGEGLFYGIAWSPDGRPRVRPHAQGRSHLRRGQPRGASRRRRKPIRPHGVRDRPRHERRDEDDRARAGARAAWSRLREHRGQGLRQQLAGPVGVRHRYGDGSKDRRDHALSARQPRPGRSPERDRRQPGAPRGLHGQRELRHGLGHRHRHGRARGDDRRLARAGRSQGRDPRRARGLPRR